MCNKYKTRSTIKKFIPKQKVVSEQDENDEYNISTNAVKNYCKKIKNVINRIISRMKTDCYWSGVVRY